MRSKNEKIIIVKLKLNYNTIYEYVINVSTF